jgi:hypothetical protein
MTVESGYAVSEPSIWYRFGFRYRFDEALFDWRNQEPQADDWFAPSALCTRVKIRVSWLDRLRLLCSGTCEVSCHTRTDVLVSRAETRSQFAVLPP